MKSLLIVAITLLNSTFATAALNHKELVGRYKVTHSYVNLTLIITEENKVRLFERPASSEDYDYIDCKADSYRIINNVFETVLACDRKGSVPFRAVLTGVDVQKLNQGVAVPVTAFGHNLNVNIQRL